MPLWPWRDGELAVYPPLPADERADVAVIGAGITGALVADALTDAGANVVVIDKRDVAAGSSAATSGLLMHETDTPLAALIKSVGPPPAQRAWQMGVEAIDHIERLIAGLGDACGFARRDSFYLASSRWHVRRLHREAALRQSLGFSAEWIDEPELRSRHGLQAYGAILTRGNAQVDCFRLTHRLLQRAVQRGARVYARSAVERVDAHGDGLRLSVEGGGRIDARRVVWAAGYEGVEETQRRVGRLRSTWIVASEPLPASARWPGDALIWESARPYLYARVTDDERILVGGEDSPFATRHANERVMQRKADRLVARFAQIRPDHPPLEPSFRWGGTFSETKDGLPYIGSVPEHPNAWLALGYGGNGITFSSIAARLIGSSWLGRPEPDAAIFAFDRH